MCVILLIVILTAIFLPGVLDSMKRGREGSTIGGLMSLRSALSIYYSETDTYPQDNLRSLTVGKKWMKSIPMVRGIPHHADNNYVVAESTITDSGSWTYNPIPDHPNFGKIHVGSFLPDSRGRIWSSY